MDALEVLIGGTIDPTGRRGRDLIRAAGAGHLTRIAPGRFVDAAAWRQATPIERHRTRIVTVMPLLADRSIVSHASAAALWGLPRIGEFPERVTVIDPSRTTGQRRVLADKVGGAGRRIPYRLLGSLRVTMPAVTGVDIALRADRRQALAVLDGLLRAGIQRDALHAELDSRTNPRGASRARALIDLADGRSGSAGESLARLRMHDLGCPTPVLQHTFHDARGFIGTVDFWFPDQGVIVEFDGLIKYRDPALRDGRTVEEVVIAEKRREDRLRALREVSTVVRLLWRDVDDGGDAPGMLARAGLPVRRAVARAW